MADYPEEAFAEGARWYNHGTHIEIELRVINGDMRAFIIENPYNDSEEYMAEHDPHNEFWGTESRTLNTLRCTDSWESIWHRVHVACPECQGRFIVIDDYLCGNCRRAL